VSLSPRYCKQLCQYVVPLCVSISTLLQAALPVCRPTECLYLHVNASSCVSMSSHCVSPSPRYCKQLCQYVDTLCVSISTLMQAAVPVCRPTVCLYLHVTASSCASMSKHCVSICTLLQAAVPVCRPTVCLYLHTVFVESGFALRRRYILRNVLLGDFVHVRTSNIVLIKSQMHTHAIRYSLLLLGYKPAQHVTVLNTVGNCNTMVSIVIFNVNKYPTDSTVCSIYRKATLHVSGVTAPIIRSIESCTRSLRYSSYYLYRYSPPTSSDRDCRSDSDQTTLEGSSGTSSVTCTGGCGYSF